MKKGGKRYGANGIYHLTDSLGLLHCGCGWVGKPDGRTRRRNFSLWTFKNNVMLCCPRCGCGMHMVGDPRPTRNVRKRDLKKARRANQHRGRVGGRATVSRYTQAPVSRYAPKGAELRATKK